MILISKTYWAGAPMNFRRPPDDALLESLVLKAPDGREHRALYWRARRNPNPKTAVVVMHPRGDFSHHYVIPRLVAAGIGCLGANTRNPNNDTTTVHEEIILDVASCVHYLKNIRGLRHVILIGNSGGGPLNGFFQAEARKPKGQRLGQTPAGDRTRLNDVDMVPADGLINISSHKGEGMIMNEIIDPAVVDENEPLRSDPALDMYEPANGFKPAPQWSTYDEAFVTRFREGQLARVHRLDCLARAYLDDNRQARERRNDPGFDRLSPERQRAVLRQECFEPVLTIHRTMANLHYVDGSLDPSNRDYGSLFSPRPDLMNFKFFGFGRLATPEAWLSTWSGLSSRANQLVNLAAITEPLLMVNAGKDMEIYPATDAQPMFAAAASRDKKLIEFPNARHYFEPEPGADSAPDVEALMDAVVPWIEDRFAL